MLLAEKIKKLDKFSQGFNDKQGKVIAGRISQNQELVDKLIVKFVKTPSLNLNEVMGGGFPKGRITIVSGLPDSGKTFNLLETIGENMKTNPDFVAGWLESEASLNISDLEMFGIDADRFWYIEADSKGAEESLNAVQAALATGAIDFFVINSLKCLVPSEELSKGFDKQQVGLQARLNSKLMRKLAPVVSDNDVAFVMVQHLSTDIGSVSYDPLTLSGGFAIKYGASIILDYRKKSISDSDPIKKEEGVKIGVTVRKNHTVTNKFPYLKTEYYGLFGQGTEKYLEAIDLAMDAGIVKRGGAWYSILDENTGEIKLDKNNTPLKWQGLPKFRNYCKENPDFFNDLLSKLNGKVEQLSEEEIDKILSLEEQEKGLAQDVDFEEEDIIKKSKKKK